MYNSPLYKYINVCVYMWPKLLHPLCSCTGYGPSGTLSRYFNCSAVNNKVCTKVIVIKLETAKMHTKRKSYKIRTRDLIIRMYI